jgi:hypothetical protein
VNEQNQQSASGVWGSSWLNKQEQHFWLISRPVSMFDGKPYALFESVCRDRVGSPRSVSTLQPEQNESPKCLWCERYWKKHVLRSDADMPAPSGEVSPPTTPNKDTP